LQGRTADLQESLEYQTATSDVLKVISRSTFDLQPILDTLVETAARLCAADSAQIATREGDACRNVASFMLTPEYDALAQGRLVPIERGHVAGRTMLEQRIIHIADVAVDPEYTLTEVITVGGYRTLLGVPLWRAGEVIGTINLGRQRVEPFTDRQIELVSTFADQAVIAIENTRLLGELREALEQQTATAEVLQVINASPGNVAPVFDAMLKKAIHLCRASAGIFWTHGGGQFRAAAISAMPPAFVEFLRTPLTPGPTTALARTVQQRRMMHRLGDMREGDAYRSRDPFAVATVELGGFRSIVAMPLVKDGELLGSLSLYRRKVEAFTDKEVGSLPSFAAQAVIAMENARLLGELRQRQEELRATFENMGDGVAMFDDTPRLVAWNRKFQDILDLPDGALSDRLTFAEYIRYLTERDEFGAGADPEEQIRRLTENTDQYRAFERVRPDGRVIEVRHNPVPGGGFVLIYADITERKRNEGELRAARDAAEEASRTIEAAYRDLKAAQANLIQAEKMASLGQLTAGIAHEIKNPLNFVNNFAELSVDLLDELNEAVANNRPAEVEELTGTLKGNLGKIAEHGRRADGIVRGMLEHSRGSSGEQRSVDLMCWSMRH
jgi:two-component system NtrC family sensor kinase